VPPVVAAALTRQRLTHEGFRRPQYGIPIHGALLSSRSNMKFVVAHLSDE
jgi:hypothetical protein